MRRPFILPGLLLLYCLTSFQCNYCQKKPLLLGSTKSWFPLKGKTGLTFLDNAGYAHIFDMKVTDTTEIRPDECGNSYQYQYINASLYLNADKTDSIYFNLTPSDYLCIQVISDSVYNVSLCDVFENANHRSTANRMSNRTIGNNAYKDVILIVHNSGFPDNIDSIFIADNAGIVGFKYQEMNYSLR